MRDGRHLGGGVGGGVRQGEGEKEEGGRIRWRGGGDGCDEPQAIISKKRVRRNET